MGRLFLLLAVSLASAPWCNGWGRDGHSIIASLAQSLLTPAALKGALTLLQHDSPPVQNLSAVSSWADEIAHTPDFSWTEPLHFTNVQDASKSCLTHGDNGGYGNVSPASPAANTCGTHAARMEHAHTQHKCSTYDFRQHRLIMNATLAVHVQLRSRLCRSRW